MVQVTLSYMGDSAGIVKQTYFMGALEADEVRDQVEDTAHGSGFLLRGACLDAEGLVPRDVYVAPSPYLILAEVFDDE